MTEWFSAAELAGLPGMQGTAQGVNKAAKREGWRKQKRSGRAGAWEYRLSSLPESTRIHIAAQTVTADQHDEQSSRIGAAAGRRLRISHELDEAVKKRNRIESAKRSIVLDESSQQRMDAKLAIIRALEAFQKRAGLGITRARASFADAYAARTIQIPDDVYEIVPHLSAASLANWQRERENEGVAALAGNYGNRKGSGKIDSQPPLRDLVVATLTEYPHTSAANVMSILKVRFGRDESIKLPSKRAVERWIGNWKAGNREVYTAVTNPDQWKNDYMIAYGSRSEGITGINQLWEMDATPGDLLLSDGRHSLSGLIDVGGRRPKLLVTKTPTAEAHCTLLRKAISEWGVPESIKHDGGQDYVARRMMRVFDSLDIESHKCQPFSPWEKPHIERFFRTFSHQLVELLPGYIGHDVADRKQIEARKAFSERLFKKDGTLELRMSSVEFQLFCDEWIESVYMHDAHASLGGRTPFEVCAAARDTVNRIDDERMLDLLLAAAPGDGFRTATKKGIRIEKLLYIAPELADHAGERLQVLYDPNDMGYVYCYADEGFVCVAECPEVTGISRRDVAIEAKHRQSKRVTEARKQLKAEARKQNLSDIAMEIVADRRSASRKLIELPKRSVEHKSEGINAARDALAALNPKTLSDAESEALSGKAAAEIIAMPVAFKPNMADPGMDDFWMMTEPERFDCWLHLNKRREAGEELSDEQKRYMKSYQGSPAWKSFYEVYVSLELVKK